MKKILSISPWPSLWMMGKEGGSPSEGYAIRAMLEAGFSVTHVTPGVPVLSDTEGHENLRFIRLENPFKKLVFLKKSGVSFFYSLPTIIAWTSEVSRWLEKSGEMFDLVVGHGLETTFALSRTARFLKVPSISRLYGISVSLESLRKPLLRERFFHLMYLLRRPPGHIILTDDGTCGDQAMGMFGIPSSRYDFIRNGYEPELLKIKPQIASPSYVLTAARLVEEKRVDRVIQIAYILKDRHPDLGFIILGEGPERQRLVRLAKKLGITDKFFFKGSVSRSKVHEILSGASVVLSTQDASNLNNTVLEALVLGKPVVTLDVGCTRELVRHEETGLLYKDKDLEGAAKGIERVLRDSEFRKTLAMNARTLARSALKPWPARIADEAAIYRRFI